MFNIFNSEIFHERVNYANAQHSKNIINYSEANNIDWFHRMNSPNKHDREPQYVADNCENEPYSYFSKIPLNK